MERVLALLGGGASPWSAGVRLVASGLALYGAYRVLSFARWRARVAGSAPGPKTCSWWLGDGALLMEAGGFNLKLFSTLHERCGPVARLLLGPTILNYSIAQVDLISEAYRLLPDRPNETKFFLFYLYPSSPNDVIG
jgi:hypothetical protein